MAYFASVQLPSGAIYINLDYVLRVDVGADASDLTAVRMTNGEIIKLPSEEANKLTQQLDACNRRV